MSGAQGRVPVGIVVEQCLHERAVGMSVQETHGMSGVYCISGARWAPMGEDHGVDKGFGRGKTGTERRTKQVRSWRLRGGSFWHEQAL